MEEEYKKELESILSWLEASKSDMIGETSTNVLFLIQRLSALLSK
jgi:hypothetical protein